MGQEQENWVYLMESDPNAVARANRRVQTILFTIFASFVTIGVWAWWGNQPDGIRPGLPLVATLWAGGILVSLLCFRVRGMVKGGEAAIGGDFLTASMPTLGRGMTIVEYKDIRTVNIGLSKDRIVEIGIRARRLTELYIQHVQDPAIAVRAIFEWGPAHVKWRRLRWPWTRLTRDEVRALIDQADLPNMDTLLPPGAIWARVDNVFVRQANGRLSAGGSPRSIHMVARGSLREPHAATDD
ncbi:hypothetical protein [Anaerobaca lacustris]|uniref:Uncharacterized protein n=1 Tax=Anaerobaca lacustris TaxID=3044600 RepID=A0AAW6TVU1_9BACT|nr:hypothetical protein [Sedimentisphaerales bacterium M17dextr]